MLILGSLVAIGCESSDGGGPDTSGPTDPGSGTDLPVSTDTPTGSDPATIDPGSGSGQVGSCLAHITTSCAEYELPAGAPSGEMDTQRTWCTGPKVWTEGPCPTEGLLGTCTVPPVEGAGFMTSRYLYYSASLIAGAQTTCAAYPGGVWTTP